MARKLWKAAKVQLKQTTSVKKRPSGSEVSVTLKTTLTWDCNEPREQK